MHGCGRLAVLRHCVLLAPIVLGLNLSIALVILGLIENGVIGKVAQLLLVAR